MNEGHPAAEPLSPMEIEKVNKSDIENEGGGIKALIKGARRL